MPQPSQIVHIDEEDPQPGQISYAEAVRGLHIEGAEIRTTQVTELFARLWYKFTTSCGLVWFDLVFSSFFSTFNRRIKTTYGGVVVFCEYLKGKVKKWYRGSFKFLYSPLPYRKVLYLLRAHFLVRLYPSVFAQVGFEMQVVDWLDVRCVVVEGLLL